MRHDRWAQLPTIPLRNAGAACLISTIVACASCRPSAFRAPKPILDKPPSALSVVVPTAQPRCGLWLRVDVPGDDCLVGSLTQHRSARGSDTRPLVPEDAAEHAEAPRPDERGVAVGVDGLGRECAGFVAWSEGTAYWHLSVPPPSVAPIPMQCAVGECRSPVVFVQSEGHETPVSGGRTASVVQAECRDPSQR